MSCKPVSNHQRSVRFIQVAYTGLNCNASLYNSFKFVMLVKQNQERNTDGKYHKYSYIPIL